MSRLAVHHPSNTVISCTSEKFPVTRSRRHFKQRLVCFPSQAFTLERNVHKHNVYVKRARQSNLIQRSNYLDLKHSSFTNWITELSVMFVLFTRLYIHKYICKLARVTSDLNLNSGNGCWDNNVHVSICYRTTF